MDPHWSSILSPHRRRRARAAAARLCAGTALLAAFSPAGAAEPVILARLAMPPLSVVGLASTPLALLAERPLQPLPAILPVRLASAAPAGQDVRTLSPAERTLLESATPPGAPLPSTTTGVRTSPLSPAERALILKPAPPLAPPSPPPSASPVPPVVTPPSAIEPFGQTVPDRPAAMTPPPAAVLADPEMRRAQADLVAAPSLIAEPAGTAPAGQVEVLRDAIIASLKTNPDIQIALAQQDDARWGVHQAGAGYLPHVDATAAIGGEMNRPAVGDYTRLRRSEATVNLTQNIWDFGVTINDIKRARADYRSAQWATRERIEAISYDISAAYLSVLEKQKLVDLSNASIAAHQKILRMVTVQNDLGLTTPADVSRAKARLESIKSELLDRQSALEQAREGYKRLTLHLPALAIDLPPTEAALPASADAAVDMIDDHSPRMAQAVQDRRSLEKQRDSQTGTFFPRVGLLVQGNFKDDVQGRTGYNRDARAMLTVTYNFLNGGADVAVRNRISARLRQADYELDRRRLEVEQDIRIDFSAMEAAHAKIGTINDEIESAQKVDTLYRQQFREGRRSVFDLLDSQQLLFNARANQISNLTAKTLAEFRVLQKLGGLFDLLSQGEKLPDIVTEAPGRGRKGHGAAKAPAIGPADPTDAPAPAATAADRAERL